MKCNYSLYQELNTSLQRIEGLTQVIFENEAGSMNYTSRNWRTRSFSAIFQPTSEGGSLRAMTSIKAFGVGDTIDFNYDSLGCEEVVVYVNSGTVLPILGKRAEQEYTFFFKNGMVESGIFVGCESNSEAASLLGVCFMHLFANRMQTAYESLGEIKK